MELKGERVINICSLKPTTSTLECIALIAKSLEENRVVYLNMNGLTKEDKNYLFYVIGGLYTYYPKSFLKKYIRYTKLTLEVENILTHIFKKSKVYFNGALEEANRPLRLI